MNRLLLLHILVFYVFFQSCKINSSTETDEESFDISMANYIDKKKGFSIDYPSSWTLRTNDPQISLIGYNPIDTSIGFVEHFNIIELYVPENIKNLDLFDQYTSNFKTKFSNYEVVKFEKITINNLNAYYMSFVSTINNVDVLGYFILYSNLEKAFALSMLTSHQENKEREKLFREVYKSFKLL